MRFSSDEVMPVPLDSSVCRIGDALLSATISVRNVNNILKETAARWARAWKDIVGWWWNVVGAVDRQVLLYLPLHRRWITSSSRTR